MLRFILGTMALIITTPTLAAPVYPGEEMTSYYTVLKDAVTADLKGPHAGIARHKLAFQNGRIVQEYIAFNRGGCWLDFPWGSIAELRAGEELILVQETVRASSRPNCLEWEDREAEETVCVKPGQPTRLTVVAGKVTRAGQHPTLGLSCIFTEALSEDEVPDMIEQTFGSYLKIK